ncbi:hypothetical protein AVEN_273019-1 [Araneus ventricosus]|uniref:Uncharacterized protein n=1 Tax=Araneus ventricosus TaxID=182803 RepID=A0A4Y2EZT2_ARAVE|nr:hypothetical protein AVEN_273019-1 [Araneus ventricosus]
MLLKVSKLPDLLLGLIIEGAQLGACFNSTVRHYACLLRRRDHTRSLVFFESREAPRKRGKWRMPKDFHFLLRFKMTIALIGESMASFGLSKHLEQFGNGETSNRNFVKAETSENNTH